MVVVLIFGMVILGVFWGFDGWVDRFVCIIVVRMVRNVVFDFLLGLLE